MYKIIKAKHVLHIVVLVTVATPINVYNVFQVNLGTSVWMVLVRVFLDTMIVEMLFVNVD